MNEVLTVLITMGLVFGALGVVWGLSALGHIAWDRLQEDRAWELNRAWDVAYAAEQSRQLADLNWSSNDPEAVRS